MFYFLLLILGVPLFAAPLEINQDHSHISYKIPYMSFSESEGAFSRYYGLIEFDSETNRLKSLEATIDASSINTQDKKRDAHLRRSDFFYVEKFPSIHFKSDSIQPLSHGLYQVMGILEIRGVKRAITLKTEFKGRKRDHVGKESYFFKASTQINRRDFGILWNKSLDHSEYLLGDIVTIDLVIQAQPQGKKTAFSVHMIPANTALENYAQLKRAGLTTNSPKTNFVKKDHPLQGGLQRSAPPRSTFSFPWKESLVGFVGFCTLILVSYFIKLKWIKSLKLVDYSESSFPSLISDAIIIGLTFIYSVWFFKYLYP
jgi:polyisoprenoid-binding protein YceI